MLHCDGCLIRGAAPPADLVLETWTPECNQLALKRLDRMGVVFTGRPVGVSSLTPVSAPTRQVTTCKKFKVVKVVASSRN